MGTVVLKQIWICWSLVLDILSFQTLNHMMEGKLGKKKKIKYFLCKRTFAVP